MSRMPQFVDRYGVEHQVQSGVWLLTERATSRVALCGWLVEPGPADAGPGDRCEVCWPEPEPGEGDGA